MNPVTLRIEHGRKPLVDGSGGRKGGLRFTLDGVTNVFDWTGVAAEDRSAFIASNLRTIEKRLAVTEWYWDGYWVTSEKPKPGSKPKPCHTLCLTTVHGDGYGSSHTCCRPVPEGETECGIHAAATRKRQATNERWKAQAQASRERGERSRALTADLRELWTEACDLFDIEPERRGEPRVEGTTARTDNEVLSRLLRTLIERSL